MTCLVHVSCVTDLQETMVLCERMSFLHAIADGIVIEAVNVSHSFGQI